MHHLRTVSTRRLLASIAGLVIVAVSGSAIAVAATSGGPVPVARPLADAVHSALTARAPVGISARVTFTNNLIASADIQGTDPLLTGASGRLWLTKGHLRIELQSSNGDAQIVVDGTQFWAYDPTSNTVYRGTLPADQGAGASGSSGSASGSTADAHAIPTIAQIQTELGKLATHLTGLTAIPTDVAGQPAYSVRLAPAQSGGLLGSVQFAWDAVHGVPLSIAVYAKGDATPVLSLAATSISFGAVPLADFAIAPPSDAKVVSLDTATGGPGSAGTPRGAGTATPLTFTASEPASAAGLDLTKTRRVGRDAVLLTYGSGPGAVAVLERGEAGGSASAGGSGAAGVMGGGPGSSLSLPTVTIDNSSATELATELGSALSFTRAGVHYLVLGSAPLATVEGVARAL